MNIHQLLAYINAQHATTFELAGKLEGGHQDGAFMLAEPSGRRVVLKQLFAPRALPIIRRLRAIGYPTPGVIYDGIARDGTTYLIQDLVPGAPLATLTEAYLDQILALNEMQANLNPQPAANALESWSGYVYEAVFAPESILAQALGKHSSATAGLLDALRRATSQYAGTVLANTDVVHGDLHNANILAEHGQITGVIDMVYAGYGTRAIDLVTLLHTMDSGGYAPAIRQRLRAHVIERFGADVYAICMAYRAIVTVEWAIRQRAPDWIDRFVRDGWSVCEELKGLRTED